MAFTREIASDQKLLIPSYRETWKKIALSIDRIDRQKATEAIQSVYKLLDLPSPKIRFFDSLYAAAIEAKQLYERPYFSEDGTVQATEILYKLYRKFNTDNWEAIGHWDIDLQSQLTVNSALEAIDRQLSESLRSYLIKDKPIFRDYPIDWFLPFFSYANEGGFFDFHFSVASNTLFQPYDKEAWEVFQKLIKSCSWIIPFEEICLVSDRPTKFVFDSDNLLHAEREAALQFSDGTGLYSYHGVALPERYGKLSYTQWQTQWLLEETDTNLKLNLVRAIAADSQPEKSNYFIEALERAAWLGRLNIVQYILETEKGVYKSLSNVLAHGVWSHDLQILQILIEAGANVNSETDWGSPLIAAVRTGDVSVVRYLVKAGADPNLAIDYDG